MSKPVTDPRNPGAYALLLRTGVANNLRIGLPDTMKKRHAELRRSAEKLRNAGLLSDEAYSAIREKISRREGVKMLRSLRVFHNFPSRRDFFARLRNVSPPGITSYDFRMARDARA